MSYNEHHLVVWYDDEHVFADFVRQFEVANCCVVSAAQSMLCARREAEAIYRGRLLPIR